LKHESRPISRNAPITERNSEFASASRTTAILKTGQELVDLVKAVGSEWCDPPITDPYVDMALVAPSAVNWQIKQSPLGEDTNSNGPEHLKIRLQRLTSDRDAFAETEKPYDPCAVMLDFLKQVRKAMEQTA
jgi:hypothetical protein